MDIMKPRLHLFNLPFKEENFDVSSEGLSLGRRYSTTFYVLFNKRAGVFY
jgi:hypothetical protein